MEMDQSLIDKFLENRCSADEARLVHRYLTSHPEILDRKYGADWEAAGAGVEEDGDRAEQVYQVIRKRIGQDKGARLIYIRWAAAAAIVLMVWSSWQFWSAGPVVDVPAKLVATSEKRLVQKDTTSWQLQENKTKQLMKIKLPDGSMVSLSPAGVIKYPTVFAPRKRDILLEGEALFEVVKDKARPFTVYTGGLSTTALGTSFRVRYTAAAVRVQLLTGKVVVKAVQNLLPGWKSDVYLLPGQQMRYEGGAGLVRVSAIEAGRPVAKAPVAGHEGEQEMVFEDTPLPEVLDKLAKRYQVTITYTPAALKGLHFSGRVLHNDSLPVLLQVIGRMNDLSVASVPDGFTISKGADQ